MTENSHNVKNPSVALTPAQQLAEAGRLFRRQAFPEAISLCQQFLQHQPEHTQAFQLLLQLYQINGNYMLLADASLCAWQKQPTTAATKATVQAAYTALRQLQRHQEAISLLQHALVQLAPWPALRMQLGLLFKETGDFEQALQQLNQAIVEDPQLYQAYWLRADLLKKPEVSDLTQLQQQLARPDLPADARAYLHYALARALEFLGHYAASFSELSLGAAAKRQCLRYDHGAELASHQRSSLPFKPLSFAAPNTSEITPIFICGMPRSGTTLTEQILSSHPSVTAGDELFELARATASVLTQSQQRQPYPLWAQSMTEQQWQQLGQQYLACTAHLHGRGYFTDKMPLNYKAIGIIAKALPQAKIIHCQRQPLDMLFSCYKQLFAEGIAFSYDLTELAEMYQAYRALMAQWQQLLPGRMYSLPYEALLQQQRIETEQLLAFVGLDWHDNCLNFHQNRRAVFTVSSTQVRQPLFFSGQDFWLHYAPQLAPLAALLTQDTADYQQQLQLRLQA